MAAFSCNHVCVVLDAHLRVYALGMTSLTTRNKPPVPVPSLASGFSSLCLILVHLLSAPLGFMKTMLLLPSGPRALVILLSGGIFIEATARSTSLCRGVKMGLERHLRLGWFRRTFSGLVFFFTRSSGQENTRLPSICCLTVQIDAQRWLHYFARILAQRWLGSQLWKFSSVDFWNQHCYWIMPSA